MMPARHLESEGLMLQKVRGIKIERAKKGEKLRRRQVEIPRIKEDYARGSSRYPDQIG